MFFKKLRIMYKMFTKITKNLIYIAFTFLFWLLLSFICHLQFKGIPLHTNEKKNLFLLSLTTKSHTFENKIIFQLFLYLFHFDNILPFLTFQNQKVRKIFLLRVCAQVLLLILAKFKWINSLNTKAAII